MQINEAVGVLDKYFGDLQLMVPCDRMPDCWAYKYGGCCGEKSVCYKPLAQHQ